MLGDEPFGLDSWKQRLMVAQAPYDSDVRDFTNVGQRCGIRQWTMADLNRTRRAPNTDQSFGFAKP